MKGKIERYIKNNKNLKKSGILLLVSLSLFIITCFLWNLLFSKYYIFSKQEKELLNAAKRYYEYHPEYLPKKGETREITLEKMFLENRIDSLYIPKTNKLCDTNSWVKVYMNEKGNYEYYTYLKCGKYESKIDHTGPTITLNGNEKITINFGEPYKDLGVKSVIDNRDGEIDISKVEIDSSNVNVNEIGDYVVKYKVKDKLNNQTIVTRNVKVLKNLTEITKQNTDETNYYKGAVGTNYVQFSGMLFRIINVNEDGTVKLISDDIVSNLRYNEEKYEGSNIDVWLKNEFLPSITSSDYLVETEYCVGNMTSIDDYNGACSEKYKNKVGLLNLNDYYKTISGYYSSITYKNSTMLSIVNKLNGKNAYINEAGIVNELASSKLVPIKPVITIKKNAFINSGNGTITNPYKLDDYEYGVEHDKLNTRIIGEYFKYSGIMFRIIRIDDNNNVIAIAAEPLINNTTEFILPISVEEIDKYELDTSNDKNPIYTINNDYIDYIDESKIIKNTYKVYINDSSKKYNDWDSKDLKVKLMMASSIDLFSGLNTYLTKNEKNVQIFADQAIDLQNGFILNVSNGLTFELPFDSYGAYAVKPKITLDGNVKIKSGKGTVAKPYIIN